VELAGGVVEEERMKGRDWCLKLTCGIAGDKLIFLSFSSQKECQMWLTKCIKVCIHCFRLHQMHEMQTVVTDDPIE